MSLRVRCMYWTVHQILATNIANFIVENDLDGFDLDWEYPSVVRCAGHRHLGDVMRGVRSGATSQQRLSEGLVNVTNT